MVYAPSASKKIVNRQIFCNMCGCFFFSNNSTNERHRQVVYRGIKGQMKFEKLLPELNYKKLNKFLNFIEGHKFMLSINKNMFIVI